MRPALHRRLPALLRRVIDMWRWTWDELFLLSMLLIVLLGTYLFLKIADAVQEGETQRFDTWVLRSLRRADDPAVPIGPAWLRGAALDATALGSPLVIVLLVAGVAGFMLLQRQPGVMWLTLVSTVGGALVALLLKEIIGRPRPAVVPRLREVSSPSFPSGHAMLSAIVYLSLAILLIQIVPDRLTRIYCLLWALFLALLAGLSRIYLGVHYPTDVLAGWIAGIVWALLCWLLAQHARRRRIIRTEGAPASMSGHRG